MSAQKPILFESPETVLAKDVQPGDLLDLYGDLYADPDKNAGEGLEFELALVDGIRAAEPVEGVAAVLIYTFSINFKCPADHQLQKHGYDPEFENESGERRNG